MGHISTIPVLLTQKMPLFFDHQVHNSIQMAVNMVKHKGVHVEMVRHNRFRFIRRKIIIYEPKHKHIWYMADGIYSMFGDVSPVKQVIELMNKYPELHYYVDDAPV